MHKIEQIEQVAALNETLFLSIPCVRSTTDKRRALNPKTFRPVN